MDLEQLRYRPLTVIGIVLLLLGLGDAGYAAAFVHQAVPTTARVVQITERRSTYRDRRPFNVQYDIELEFRTTDGRLVRPDVAGSLLARWTKPPYQPGQTLPVLYIPAEPHLFAVYPLTRINTFGELWMRSLICLMLSLACLTLSLGLDGVEGASRR